MNKYVVLEAPFDGVVTVDIFDDEKFHGGTVTVRCVRGKVEIEVKAVANDYSWTYEDFTVALKAKEAK